MSGTQLECRVVALLGLVNQTLLLEGIGQITVGVREVGLELDSSSIGINGQVDEPLLIVDTGKVTVHDGMVRGEVQSSQVGGHSPEKENKMKNNSGGFRSPLPVKYPGFFQHIPQVDVGIQKVGIQRHGLLKVVNGEPYLSLGIKDTAQVRPSHGKVRSGLYSFQITSLDSGDRVRTM